MPTDLFPVPYGTAVPLVAVVKHVFQLSVTGHRMIRSKSFCEIETVLDAGAYIVATPLAEIDHSVLGVSAPFKPRSRLGNVVSGHVIVELPADAAPSA